MEGNRSTDEDVNKSVWDSAASASVERGLGAAGPSSSKLLNYREIKLYKVLDNKFVGRGHNNLTTFDKNKKTEEFFNFVGDGSGGGSGVKMTTQGDQQ